jgi:hypothetical protein
MPLFPLELFAPVPAPCAIKTIAANKVNATATKMYLVVFMPFDEL